MNSKRSYLDALNAGRQRRTNPSLDQITQSLQNLESKLDRNREPADDLIWSRPPVEPRHGLQERQAPSPRLPARSVPAEQPYQSIARDIDRVRGQEDGVASVSKIANELKGLREELRQQMTSGIHREFDTLRQGIEHAYASASPAAVGTELSGEIKRISAAINNLSERSDEKSMNLLRVEIEQVKRALDKLAREETVQSVDRRWDEFDRRWSDFETRVDERQRAPDPAISVISGRLQAIGDAVNSLPESLSLRSLEEKVRTLASAVDHFVRQQERQAPEISALIEDRLDEISRAIVASTSAAQVPNFDPEPFQRIEARISALAHQIEEVAEDRPSAEVIDHLNQLSRRVDELAAKGAVPDQAVERLTRQIDIIADKIDSSPAAPDSDLLFQGIEQRFDVLSQMIERRQGDAIEQGNAMFRDLENRLEEFAERLDRRTAEPTDNGRVMAAIDARFSAFADQIATGDASGEAIRGLEMRLESISDRLDASSAQFASIDPTLIRSLESQVSALSAHLSRPSSALPDFEDIGPRLNDLERSISGSRDSILEAAREAAENAVRSFNGSQTHTAAVTGLAQDMRALEALTRRSDQRNSKTFEAIHDTLIKIVDRLGALDTLDTDGERPVLPRFAPEPSVKLEVADAPSIDPDRAPRDGSARFDAPQKDESARGRSPSEAAADAALAAVGSEHAADATRDAQPKSLLGGFVRALGRKGAPAEAMRETASPDLDSPKADLDQSLDPKFANRLLEPGSGTPDLNAIMKRVRDERGQPARTGEPDAAKSDFIAAARRAAQAAAAEAEVLKRNADSSGEARSFRMGDLVKSRRKPILMAAAAIMIALAGLQLGKAFIGGSNETADAGPESMLLEEPAEIASTSAPTMSAPLSKSAPSMEMSSATAVPVDGAGAKVRAAEATPIPAPEAAVPTQTAAVAPAPEAIPAPPAATVVPASIPVEAGPVALREAAEEGDAKALFEVGSRYADGRGITADMKQAAKWYEKSAELGFAPAQYRIGNFYEKGLGVDRDVAKSKTWYQLAAAQGNASAMHNLAVLYAMGADGTADNESAARWFISAADLGIKDSQFNLGILAAKGVGIPQSLEESYKWFAIVAKTGDRDAAAKRDEIANSLRPEQLEKARATVELWRVKPLDPEANSVEIPESWQESAGTTASIDMKKAIGNIQRILNKNGYDAGNPDGVMGQKTKDAVVAFQKDNGLDPTGTVDEKLVRALIAKK